MSKKNLTKQQLRRIKKNQDLTQNKGEDEEKFHQKGLIITRFSNQAIIKDQQNHYMRAAIRQNLGPIVAGDNIFFYQDDNNEVVITSRAQRYSVLGRYDKQGILKPVAANISQMIIVFAPKPEPSTLLLDTYLVAAQTLNIKPLLLFNKNDLAPIPKEYLLYQDIGYDLLQSSTITSKGILPLKHRIEENCSVFVGQSGVGKSSLISTLIPEISVKSQEISEQSMLGKHTTSSSTLYELAHNGQVIDSPGIREFSLWKMDKHDILNGFIEFQPFLGQCQFKNCQHINEKNCALINAVKQKKIAPFRLENYLQIMKKYTSS